MLIDLHRDYAGCTCYVNPSLFYLSSEQQHTHLPSPNVHVTGSIQPALRPPVPCMLPLHHADVAVFCTVAGAQDNSRDGPQHAAQHGRLPTAWSPETGSRRLGEGIWRVGEVLKQTEHVLLLLRSQEHDAMLYTHISKGTHPPTCMCYSCSTHLTCTAAPLATCRTPMAGMRSLSLIATRLVG